MSDIQIILKATDEASSVIKGLGGSLGSLAGVASGVVVAGFAAAAAGVAAFGVGLTIALKEAMEAEEVQARLASVLKATGGVAGVTAEAATQLADSLSLVTRFSDEQIISGESLLLTFKNIGSDVFPETTQAMLDMSTAMGTDLKSSAIQLGKALNEPIEGLSALTRVGVTFSDEQEELIKTLTAAGDIAGAQRVILAELSSEFGGAAKAAGGTFAGQLDILKNKMLNVAEGVGNQLLPALGEMLSVIGPLAEQLANGIGAFFASPEVQAGIKAIAEGIKSVIESLAAGDLSMITNLIPPEIMAQIGPFTEAVRNMGATFMEWLPQIEATVTEMGATVMQVFTALGPELLANLTGILNTLTAIWDEHGATILAIITVAWNAIVLTVGGALTLVSGVVESTLIWIQGILHAVSLAMSGDWQGAWNAIVGALVDANLNMTTAVNTFFESIASKMGTSMTDIRKTWQADWDLFVVIIKQIWQNIVDTINAKWIEITTNIKTGIADSIQAVKDTFDQWVQLGRDIVENIALGISQMVAGLIQDVIDMVNAALNAAAAALAGGGSYSIPGYTGDTTGGNAATTGGGRAQQTGGNASTTGGGGGNVFNFYPSSDVDAELMARRVASILATG